MNNFHMKYSYLSERLRGLRKSIYYNTFIKKAKIDQSLRLGKHSHINIWSNGRLSIGACVYLRKYCQIHIEAGELSIGNHTFMNNFVTINCLNRISIGEHCLLGEGVKLYDHNHTYHNHDQPIKKQGYNSDEISIGNNCWIGSNVVILKGVKIGDNAVIGANSVIFKDVPANHIVKSAAPSMQAYRS